MINKESTLPVQNLGASILVVDDEPSYCKAIVRCLAMEGYNCKTTVSVEYAITLLEETEFDLLISDIMMPETSGVNLLIEVKEKWPDIAVVMMSGLDNREIFLRCLQVGAYGYLTKPFSDTQLLINVISALERRRLDREVKKLQEKL